MENAYYEIDNILAGTLIYSEAKTACYACDDTCHVHHDAMLHGFPALVFPTSSCPLGNDFTMTSNLADFHRVPLIMRLHTNTDTTLKREDGSNVYKLNVKVWI
uniref:Uncharacterized protein n=1 Tax=Alexandrium catenella TaxID=2925 RepID=A0A7S1M841_ALECA